MNTTPADYSTQFVILLGMKTSDSLALPRRGFVAPDTEIDAIRLRAAIAKRDEPALDALYDATISRVCGLGLRIMHQLEAAAFPTAISSHPPGQCFPSGQAHALSSRRFLSNTFFSIRPTHR